MKLNHINLIMSDVAAAIAFFEKYFGFTCTEVKGNNIVAVLKGSDGFTLVILNAKDGPVQYPHAFHIGFMQDSEAAVWDIHKKLKENGFEVGEGPKNIRDSFGFYFTFDQVVIEVGYYRE